MPGWLWIVLGVVVAGVAVGVGVYVAGRAGIRMTEELLADGELVRAWIVDVEEEPQGLLGRHALLVFSPDEVEDEVMRAVVRRLEQLRDRKPRDGPERKAAAYVKDSTDAVGRLKVPRPLCDDHEVYANWMLISAHELKSLGGEKALDNECIDIRLFWDRHEAIVVPEPRRKKRLRYD